MGSYDQSKIRRNIILFMLFNSQIKYVLLYDFIHITDKQKNKCWSEPFKPLNRS